LTVTITLLPKGGITLETTGNEEVIVKTPIAGHSTIPQPGSIYGIKGSIDGFFRHLENIDNKE
jgi:hypothetical protein